MKKTSNGSILVQFLLLAFWFATSLTSESIYRMLVSAVYFEFPCMIILLQSVSCLILLQIFKLLFPDVSKSWNDSVDPKALPASLLLLATVFLDLFAFYHETSFSKLIAFLAAPMISILTLKSSRVKIGKKIPVVMSLLSVVFSYSSINIVDLSPTGILFGFSVLLFNMASLVTLRRYLKSNGVSRFLVSHCTFSTVILFVLELYLHDVHRVFLYLRVWQLPYFPQVFFSFLLFFSASLISLCHVITRFNLSTMAVSLNTKGAWLFLIVNYLYRYVAEKEFHEIDFSAIVSSVAAFLANLAVFWIDASTRTSSVRIPE